MMGRGIACDSWKAAVCPKDISSSNRREYCEGVMAWFSTPLTNYEADLWLSVATLEAIGAVASRSAEKLNLGLRVQVKD